MFPARNFREQDTVISIPSRFEPSDRSRAFGGRPTLAFFGGSPNSCARRRVLELYSRAAGFDVSSNGRSLAAREGEWGEGGWLGGSTPGAPPALFLPTAAIPRLGHILRHEVDEAARWRLFQNLALGSSEADGARARQLVAQAERRLDLDTLWGGLSAASVFNWARSDFWILFLADVAEKLGGRVDRAGPRELRGPAAPGGGAAAGAEGGFRWHREAWWAAERRGEDWRRARGGGSALEVGDPLGRQREPSRLPRGPLSEGSVSRWACFPPPSS
ncbi:unnamed protein product [Prorocentrum cordatum]|uniref:Uncharacterized protein n=1 Tax=Prorocentrum cordatum TaxID=2364126 RepID=A0ABN9UJ17_9DINO|nr:unnamed protein product [Polarella glacialis]